MAEEGELLRQEEQLPESSLVPIFPISEPPPILEGKASTSKTPLWLQNASFTVDVASLPLPDLPPAASVLSESGDSSGEDNDEEVLRATKRPAYELLESSSAEEGAGERGRERRRKKKRKGKRERPGDAEGGVSRKSAVDKWAGGSESDNAKGYYFDTKGDRDNLAFGCLYRMDIARYKTCHAAVASGLYFQFLGQWKKRNSVLDLDQDADSLDRKVSDVGRYYSIKYVSLERHKDFKRLRVLGGNETSAIHGDFIPLNEMYNSSEQADCGPSESGERGESWEDEVLQRTRELNRMSRECPHDEQVWLAFAEFQDKIAARQPQKAARLQTMEKKISILEKAVELNPKNEELLLCLLKAYQRRDSTEVLMERWQRILMQHSGSCKLWKEFLWFCQGEFSKFKVSDMRKTYAYAVQALSSACMKLYRQFHESVQKQAADPNLIQLELGLVDIFISLCRFEWQSGYQELATGLFQAEIEYCLFCPSLLLTQQSMQRLFEHFWNSNCPRVGEDEALGWATWLEKEEETRRKVFVQESLQEDEVGGWTGWSEALSKNNELIEAHDESIEHIAGEETTEDSIMESTIEEDVEILLKKLGVNVDADAGADVKDPLMWSRWSEEELSRDCEQWMPVHGKSGMASNNDALFQEDDEQISRIILFDDIGEYLFSLCSEEAKYSLVSQFIDFFGGKISKRMSTNSESWMEYILGLDILPEHLLEDLRKVHDVVTRTGTVSDQDKLECLLNSSANSVKQTSIMRFLRNAILICLNVFPRNYILQEALLSAEELSALQAKSFATVNPSRTLAKGLLKTDRHDLLLCGVYARSEAACGNLDVARKVFDMALTSIEGLPADLRVNAPLLYLWYSEMEVATGSNSDSSSARAIHVLSCLGSAMKYTPYNSPPSNLQILRSHQGFKEQIKSLYGSWARGYITDHSIALICSAALFEILTMGLDAGLATLSEAFRRVLPERRSQSRQLESLFCFLVKMLQKNMKQSNLANVWKSMLEGLQIYPYSPKIFAAFIEAGCLYTVPNKLRRIIDDYRNRKPSVIVTLFALSFDLAKFGSQHRIHGLFERALADDKLQKSVLLWRCYLAYEIQLGNFSAARRIYFRAIHACPWSKTLWLDGYLRLHKVLTAKELSDLQEVMRDKELRLRTDIYEILLQEEITT